MKRLAATLLVCFILGLSVGCGSSSSSSSGTGTPPPAMKDGKAGSPQNPVPNKPKAID